MMTKTVKPDEALSLDQIRQRATLTLEETGPVLGLSRGSAYAAAARGEIPTVRMGRRLVVPVPKLLALLGEK